MMEIVKHNFNFTHTPTPRKATKEIILHCTATPDGKDFTVEQIHKCHLQRKFSGIGYHYVIYRDGSIHQGRPENCGGAHTLNHNSISVGISYVGGVCEDGKTPKDTRTNEQKEAMYILVKHLMGKYNLSLGNVHGHYEYANKACPSFKIEHFKKEYNLWEKHT